MYWILWICTPLQSKTIRNSRVLGYGQLNGHVASIVSMFSKRRNVLKKELVPGRYLEKGTMYMGGTDVENAGCYFQEVLQRKPLSKSLSYLSFNKPRDTAISTRETI